MMQQMTLLQRYNMVLESKIDDFIRDNGLTKKTAFSDENITKLKKILKVRPEVAKQKLEKYF